MTTDTWRLPETMSAVRLTALGGPEFLEEAEVRLPSLSADEVLIAVHTVAANHQDVFTMSGRANIKQVDLPHIPGIDPAGVIVAVGDHVTTLTIGERVVAKPSISCGTCQYCAAGQDDACLNLQNLGVHRPGGFAQYVAVPAKNVFPIPDSLGFAEATAVAHSFPVALLMLRERAGVGADDVVLVTSASGAIGSASVQVAKVLGATVVAAAGSPERAQYAAGLGADMVIDYGTNPEFSGLIAAAYPDGVSVYVESAGNPKIWRQALETLGRKARVAVCGAHAGPFVELDLTWVFRSRVSILGSSGSSLRTFRDVMDYVAAGLMRPNVDSIRPIGDAAEAFRRLMNRENQGKVVLRVADS